MRELEREALENEPRSRRDGAEEIGRLAIVGAGRAGGAIHRAARRAGLSASLAGRQDAVDACLTADAALLCVQDSAIADACAAIGAAVPPLRLVGHVSGSHTLSSLEPAVRRGAEAFSLHPLQTIPDPDADLGGAPCAIAATSPRALEAARRLAGRLGLRPFEVPEESRAAYHAAASMASNFLVALEESAAELLAAAGVPNGRELLAPLVARTAANWAAQGPDALTGPIARGDEATVRGHREALAREAPEMLDLYLALAERTRSVANDSAPA